MYKVTHIPDRSGVHIQGIAGPPECTLHPNQGSCSAHSWYTDKVHWSILSGSAQVHWTYTPANCSVFSALHWIFLAVHVQCCTAGTLKLYWTRTPLRWGIVMESRLGCMKMIRPGGATKNYRKNVHDFFPSLYCVSFGGECINYFLKHPERHSKMCY